MTLTAPTNPAYSGVVLWQARSSTVPLRITGQASLNLTGTLYAAAAALYVGDNGQLALQGKAANHLDGHLITFDLLVTGNGTVTVDTTANNLALAPKAAGISLLGGKNPLSPALPGTGAVLAAVLAGARGSNFSGNAALTPSSVDAFFRGMNPPVLPSAKANAPGGGDAGQSRVLASNKTGNGGWSWEDLVAAVFASRSIEMVATP